MSTLQFSDYEFEKYGYMKAPQPKLNGGLYSGGHLMALMEIFQLSLMVNT